MDQCLIIGRILGELQEEVEVELNGPLKLKQIRFSFKIMMRCLMCGVVFNLHILCNIAPSGFCNSAFSAVM